MRHLFLLIRSILTALLLTGVWGILAAQSVQQEDSLLALLAEDVPDTSKFKAMENRYRMLHLEDPDSALLVLQKSLTLSKETDNPYWMCRIHLQMAYHYFWVLGIPGEARRQLKSAHPLLSVVNDPMFDASYHMYFGIIHMETGVFDTAITCFLRARDQYESIGNQEGASQCYNNIGTIFWKMGELDQALKYFFDFLAFANDLSGQKQLHNKGSALGNIGLIYKSKKRYDSALYYFEQSLAIHRQQGNQREMALNFQNMGSLYEQQELSDSALRYYLKAYDLAIQHQMPTTRVYAQHGLGAVYGMVGKYAEAQHMLEQALAGAKELDFRDLIAGIYLSQSLLMEDMDQMVKALEYRKKYEIWKDSLINENHRNRVKELELTFETSEKEQQIALLTRETQIQELRARRQRLWNQMLGGSIVLVLLIAGLAWYHSRQQLRAQKSLAAKEEELRKSDYLRRLSEVEMKALRAQMNPHFVFNCLNSINHLILKGEHSIASHYLSKFSKLLRQILEHSDRALIPLVDELATLERYIQLEELRFKNEIHTEITIDPAVDPEDTWIPSMILQPLVENAIWHGLMHKEGKGSIRIIMSVENDNLKCLIEDDGIGIEPAILQKRNGATGRKSFGLQLTRERLQLLAQKGTKAEIQIRDMNGQGTQVELTIPL